MTYNAWPDHVGNKFVFVPVPRKQHRTRTTTPIQLTDTVFLFRSQTDFILRHTRGPQQPHYFRAVLRAKSSENRRRILSEISGSARNFPFLIKRPRVHFHFRADSVFVVVQPLQIDAGETGSSFSIQVGFQPGTVTGDIRDAKDQPFQAATCVLVPKLRNKRSSPPGPDSPAATMSNHPSLS